jgi:putative flippase GtrA
VVQYIRSLFTKTAVNQLLKVAAVGVVNTIVSFSLFNLFLGLLGGTKTVADGFNWEQFWSIALSFLIATFVSYALNRRWTFQLNEPGEMRRETINFIGINVVAWAVTQGIVGGADLLFGPLTRLEQNFYYLAASGLIILPKFAGYRDIVFRKAINAKATAAAATSPSQATEPDLQGVPAHFPEG